MCRLRIESFFYYESRGRWTNAPAYDRRWWRYKIRCDNLTVYTTGPFANWDRAAKSARRQFPKVSFAIHGHHHESPASLLGASLSPK